MSTQTKTQVKFVYSDIAQKAVEIGRKNHMRFSVVGCGEVPTRPFYRGAWWFEPVKEAPDRAKERISILKSAGITFKGFVIAHEIELVEGKQEKEEENKDSQFTSSIPVSTLATTGTVVAAGVAMGLGLMLAILSAVLVDPVIIGVCEDDAWLSIITYYK